MTQSILDLVNISKSYVSGEIQAVRSVSLSVARGEILSILGPSGCGKSTTMRIIAGLDKPTSGDVRIDGRSVRDVPTHKRNIGMVFQSLAIFPHMTVRQNVAFGLRMKNVPKDEIPGRVERALDVVHLPASTYADRRPEELSGGQLQRVAVARTIVTEPALVLFDEPMAALDRRLRDHMAIELRAIQKELGIAAVYVTHDQETASMMSDRIAIMDAGQVVQIGAPVDIYERPANRFVADFLGDLNCLRALPGQAGARDRLATVRLAGSELFIRDALNGAQEAVELLIRPEHIALHHTAPSSGGVPASVSDVKFVSGQYRWKLSLTDGQEIVVRGPAGTGLAVGSAAWITVDPAHVLLAARAA